jgi:membrane fusion protein (multidrug efflux system)
VSKVAEAEAQRLAALAEGARVSESAIEQAVGKANQSRSAAEAAQASLLRTERERAAAIAQGEADLARLRTEIVQTQGDLDRSRIHANRLRAEIEERIIRAPVAGTIGDIAPLRPGTALEVGDWVATVVPSGSTKVVALFDAASAVGRIMPGQTAIVRLDAYPWLYHGIAHAVVSRVGVEREGGMIPVEFVLSGSGLKEVRLQHGLSAEVVIDVERLSPLDLVLRTVGGTRRPSGGGPNAN